MKNAVFVGRFAMLTRAHLSTAKTILRRWPRLTVGVLNLTVTPSPPPQLIRRFGEFYKLCLNSCGNEANPFSVAERIRLWLDALHHAGVAARAQPVEVIQPELDPAWFNRRFPSDEYDLVTVAPTPDCSRFDHIRTNVFRQILDRAVIDIEPPIIEHTSTILDQIANGKDWADFLAPGTLTRFFELDGPRRLQARLNRHTAQRTAAPAGQVAQ